MVSPQMSDHLVEVPLEVALLHVNLLIGLDHVLQLLLALLPLLELQGKQRPAAETKARTRSQLFAAFRSFFVKKKKKFGLRCESLSVHVCSCVREDTEISSVSRVGWCPPAAGGGDERRRINHSRPGGAESCGISANRNKSEPFLLGREGCSQTSEEDSSEWEWEWEQQPEDWNRGLFGETLLGKSSKVRNACRKRRSQTAPGSCEARLNVALQDSTN